LPDNITFIIRQSLESDGEGMNCSKCGWGGEESDLIEEPTELRINDQFNAVFFPLATKRNNYLCPLCRTPLRTAKIWYGWKLEIEDIPE
jgi:NAD-dependent SIR2 family protein deacetylase